MADVEPDIRTWQHNVLLASPKHYRRLWLRRAGPPELVRISRIDLMLLRNALAKTFPDVEEEQRLEVEEAARLV